MAINPDIDVLLSPQTALNLTTTQFALRIRDTAAACQLEEIRDINARFLEDIHSGALPPSFFRIWLPVAARRVPSLIRTALLDRTSNGIRHAGIITLKRVLSSKRWREDGWDAVGGARGLVEVFESISREQVRSLVLAIRQCNRSQDTSKAAEVDKLVHLLMPTLWISEPSNCDSTRQRFLFGELAPLLPVCSTGLLLKLFFKQLPGSFDRYSLFHGLTRSNLDLMRRIAAGTVAVHQDIRLDTIKYCARTLIVSTKPYESQNSHSGISPEAPSGVLLCLDMITSKLDIPSDRKSGVFRESIWQATKLAVHRKTHPKDIFKLLEIITSLTETWGGEFMVGDAHHRPNDTFHINVMRYLIVASFSKDNDVALSASKQNENRPLTLQSSFKRRSALKYLLTRITGRKSDVESLLIRIIRLSTPLSRLSSYSTYTKALFERDIPSEARLPFIKALFRYQRGIGIDLEEKSLSEEMCPKNFRVHVDILFLLPPDDAMWLFDRIQLIRGTDNVFEFVSRHAIIPRLNYDTRSREFEQLLKIRLEAEGASNAGKGRAEKLLPDAKRKAERCSDAEIRCEKAKYCVDIAVCSASIDLLNNVLVWARRFIRDPLAGPGLYQHITSSDVARVLACTSLPPHRRPKSRSELVTLVGRANEILSFHIETARLALREPGARHGQYNAASLLGSVVRARASEIPILSKAGIAGEKDLANIFLTSLEPILLTCEATGLRGTRKPSQWTDGSGSLNSFDFSKRPRQHILEFLDSLAQKRDQLWMKERIEREPKVADLQDGLPKGLPLQCLFPHEKWAAAAVRDEKSAPFVASRIRETVFCDRKLALSIVSEADKHTIGAFCDSLQFAMRAYIGFDEPQSERVSRLLEVWHHYSSSEWPNKSHVYSFKTWLIDFAHTYDIDLDNTELCAAQKPIVHGFENVSASVQGPLEWDPRPKKLDDAPTVNSLDTSNDDGLYTVLRYRFGATTHSGLSTSKLIVPPPWKSNILPDKGTFLGVDQLGVDLQKLPMITRDALVVAAILVLDTTFASESPRLLSNPFPENSLRIRYPALYLDYDFLASIKGNESEDASRVLKTLVGIAPPMLLYALARSMLNAVTEEPRDSDGYATLLSTTINVIKLLPRSDNPELAIDIGLDVIRQLPDDSSWYREVVSVPVVNRLNPTSAEVMAKKFGSIVLDGLAMQRLSRKDQSDVKLESEETILASNVDVTAITIETPFVKISTIKMLAQLLTTSNSFSLRTRLDILESLFAASQQIDVRRNVVEGVAELLKTSVDMEPEAADKIYASFKSFVAVAAGPNERDSISEGTWLKAEAEGSLPEISTSQDLISIFTVHAKSWIPARFRASYVQSSILPLLDESTKQHNRWMRIFLSRVDLTRDEASVTDFGPFNARLVESILAIWAEYLPREYLIRYRAWALSYVDMLKLGNIPSKMDRLHDGWRDTKDGEYVISLLDSRTTKKTLKVLGERILDPVRQSKIPDGITRERLIDEFYLCATLIIDHPIDTFLGSTPGFGVDHFSTSVYGPLRSLYRRPGASRKYIPELWQHITSYVEKKRTSDWAKDPLGNPLILPSRLLLESLLLPYPHLNDSDSHRSEIFATAISKLINRCGASASCVLDLPGLDDILDHIEPNDRFPCAIKIGQLRDKDHSQPDGPLKVRLVLKLLKDVADTQTVKGKELTEMLNSWKMSPNESIRLEAWKWESEQFFFQTSILDKSSFPRWNEGL